MSDKKVTINLTNPFFSLLTLLFIGLKLTGYVTWSWVWVLSPIWIPFVIFLAFIGFGLLLAMLAAILK